MLFTLADARKLKPLDNAVKYLDADITTAGALASDALEHACNVHFAPTAFTETLDGNWHQDLQLTTLRVTTLTSVLVAGVDVTAQVKLYPDGRIYLMSRWPYDRQNVVVTGTAGWTVTPPRVAHAALLLAKSYLVDSPVNDRATALTSPDGTSQQFVTAGVRSAVFAVPEANAVVADYGLASAGYVA